MTQSNVSAAARLDAEETSRTRAWSFHFALVLAATASATDLQSKTCGFLSFVRACKHDSQSVNSVTSVESRHAL